MSLDDAATFLRKIGESGPFQHAFTAEVPRDLGSGVPMVEFAARHGYAFTEAELWASMAFGAGDLSEADLAGVAGGLTLTSTPPLTSFKLTSTASGAFTVGGTTYTIDKTTTGSLFGGTDP